jgi:ubiquinone/menaquinone biosynthesis C-methylase UbiE
MTKLKSGVQTVSKGRLTYLEGSNHRPLLFKPWLGDSFSFLYDSIMTNSVFPRKFGGDIQEHYRILTRELAGIHGKSILELGTGSGSAVDFLSKDNQYTGTDISAGLLKQAARRFIKAGFTDPEFFVLSADELPFEDCAFDVCLCILSLNFFGNSARVFHEVSRVLVSKGLFVCCVPVPERNRLQSTIRGNLYSETELEAICRKQGFVFSQIPGDNGALLYFKAAKD